MESERAEVGRCPSGTAKGGLGAEVGVSPEDDRSGASAQDPGEAREREMVSGPMAVPEPLPLAGAHFL